MFILIGVQENDDQYLADYEDAIAVSRDRSKLERYGDQLRHETIHNCQCSHCYVNYKIEEIKDLDEE